MNESNPPRHANPSEVRLRELLADRAVGDLSPAELQEINVLLEDHPELDDGSMEEAAALLAVAEAVRDGVDDVPAGLRQTLRRDADRHLNLATGGSGPASFRETPERLTSASAPAQRSLRLRTFFAGAVAGGIAAAILVAVLLNPAIFSTPPTAPNALSPGAAYARFQENTSDLQRYTWAPNAPGYEHVAGHVAWSPSSQTGFMVFDGLPFNDPAEDQYQLWIVDPSRDEFPVDGGVFNLAEHAVAGKPKTGGLKAYVPIDAKLRVDAPAAFAVTLEKPGGVVKSDQPLLIVAAVAAEE